MERESASRLTELSPTATQHLSGDVPSRVQADGARGDAPADDEPGEVDHQVDDEAGSPDVVHTREAQAGWITTRAHTVHAENIDYRQA